MNTEKTEKTDALAAAQTALEAGIAQLVESDTWTQYLKTQARFHRYSFSNVIWLMVQASSRGVEVSQFAGFHAWKDLGRFVTKGSLSFKVLAPMTCKKTDEAGTDRWIVRGFKAVSVFDVSQTDGAPLPEVVKPLEGSSEALQASFATLADFSAKRGVPVTREDLPGSTNGFYSRTESRIVVDASLSDRQALKTLCHEVAHSILHATEEGDTRATKEVEAESAAFIAMHAMGIDTAEYSFGYVAHWSDGDTKLVKAVGDRATKAAKVIIEALGFAS